MPICQLCGTRNLPHMTQCSKCHSGLPQNSGNQAIEPPGQSGIRPVNNPQINVQGAPPMETSGHRGNMQTIIEQRLQQADASIYQHPISPNQGPPRPPMTTTVKVLIGLIAIAILVGMVVITMQISNSASGGSAVFAVAENFYDAGKNTEAMMAYQDFLHQYPNDALAPLAIQRMQVIRELLAEDFASGKIQTTIDDLMRKAELAYDNQQFLKPRRNNAISHISKILLLDPNHSAALGLRGDIIDHFAELGNTAVRKNQLQNAVDHYSKILQINPDDTFFKEQISQLTARIARAEQRKNEQLLAEQNAAIQQSEEDDNAERNSIELVETSKLLDTTAIPENNAMIETSNSSPGEALNTNSAGDEEITSVTNTNSNITNRGSRENSSPIVRSIQPSNYWKHVKSHLLPGTTILEESDNILVLYQSSINDSLVLSRDNSRHADIFGSTRQKRGGNPYRTWTAWKNNISTEDHKFRWQQFLSDNFINEIHLK